MTRESIFFAKRLAKKGWTTGSSPGVTHVVSGNDEWNEGKRVSGYFFCGAAAPFAAGRALCELSALSGSRFQVWLRPNSEMPR